MANQKGDTQLPSRDIPTNIVQDPQVQMNYIPQPQPQNRDYISEYETNESMIQNAIRKESKEQQLDHLYDEMQIPLLLAVLYFLFQLPIVRKYLNRYIPGLFFQDGQFNIYGYLFTSVLFGLAFFILQKLMQIYQV
jgi:hypothetical protein